jgi:ferredoxin-NADP reductase
MVDIPPTRRIKRGWMNLKVVDIVEETWDAKTFYFEDADEGGRPFDFIAGQYLTFRFDDIIARPVVRSYTMSGSPRQMDHALVTVKRIPGGLISNWFCDSVQVGSILRARGPIGKFCYDPALDTRHLYMIAAGSGVTPFTSIIREYHDKLGEVGAPLSLHLLVAYRTTKDLINWDVLAPANEFPNVRVITTLTRAHEPGFWHGRPDARMLDKFIGEGYKDGTFMTCGPQELMDLTSEHLRAAGVDEKRIKVESFAS